MKKITKVILSVISSFIVLFLLGIIYINSSYTPVDRLDTEPIEFIIESGTPLVKVLENLEDSKLIKNSLTMKIYAKLHPGVAQTGRYILYRNMSAIEIYDALINGNVTRDTVWLTFVEGKRLTYIASVISKNYDYTEDEIMTKMDDREFISKLMDKYSILTEKILQNGIYHPLEGYLFPDTYEFETDATIESIIETMIATTDKKLSKYSEEIKASKYDIHELLTLASIVELEGAGSNDRKGVSGVFYNRLEAGMTLGSDVTTYYAVGKDFSNDLTIGDLNSCNGYNTRGQCVKGLPLGPIASSSLDSIVAAIEPTKHEYYYFVADKNRKTYFSKTYSEHNNIVRELKNKGLWYVYQ